MFEFLRVHYVQFANYDLTIDLGTKLMTKLGYDPTDTDSPLAQAGVEIAARVIDYAKTDGSNQQGKYKDTTNFVPMDGFEELGWGVGNQMNPDVWKPLIQPINGTRTYNYSEALF